MGETDDQEDLRKQDNEALKEELDFLLGKLKALGITIKQVSEATPYEYGTIRTAKSSGTNLKYIVEEVRKYYDEVKKEKGLTPQNDSYNLQQLGEKVEDLYETVGEILKSEAETQKRLAAIENILLTHLQKEPSKLSKQKPNEDDDQQSSETNSD